MNSDESPVKPGVRLEIGVSEPPDFFLEAGDGPYLGTVTTMSPGELAIHFEEPLDYRGSQIESCIAKPRYEGESFSNWDGTTPRIVNLVVNAPTITHLIGGIRRRCCSSRAAT